MVCWSSRSTFGLIQTVQASICDAFFLLKENLSAMLAFVTSLLCGVSRRSLISKNTCIVKGIHVFALELLDRLGDMAGES